MNAVVQPSTRRGYSTAWWGMAVLIMTEAMVFAILLASYFFLRASAKAWPPIRPANPRAVRRQASPTPDSLSARQVFERKLLPEIPMYRA